MTALRQCVSSARYRPGEFFPSHYPTYLRDLHPPTYRRFVPASVFPLLSRHPEIAAPGGKQPPHPPRIPTTSNPPNKSLRLSRRIARGRHGFIHITSHTFLSQTDLETQKRMKLSARPRRSHTTHHGSATHALEPLQ